MFFVIVAVALLLYFFVFKKSSKSQPQLQPPSMQMQSPHQSMKMKIGRRFDNLDNLPIGTGVHCESETDCFEGNGCGLVTGDPNKQCCQYGTYNNHFGTVCSNKYCTSDNDCPNGCGLVIGGKPKQQCCTNGVLRTSYPGPGSPDPEMDPLDPEMGPRGSLNICV